MTCLAWTLPLAARRPLLATATTAERSGEKMDRVDRPPDRKQIGYVTTRDAYLVRFGTEGGPGVDPVEIRDITTPTSCLYKPPSTVRLPREIDRLRTAATTAIDTPASTPHAVQ
ncbi:hypothetical protein B0H66DRAFT_534329 [Apodospora peruviana]|uniref:Uncharacterized protein n=1 Tax=Apodospora peruviana TaxID=516989 RepID=A0AAE0M1W4_9PEZI|nr:hypothetical protein B0H66DRAFT_534329 [Apodospora peruviana]